MPQTKATQSFVPVKEVRNGVIILKDGGYRGVLMCSSINFALKSEDEQQAVVGGFQNFLNTLDFTVEIVVHSRKMDIRPYLALLNERMDAQSNELMRLQLREYIQFIRGFMDSTSIMTKLFYIVVPYTPALGGDVAGAVNFLKHKQGSASEQAATSFEDDRVQLEQRMALAAGGLASSGLRAVPLGTEEIIELLYRSFNLSELESPIRL
jgi:type IV secretory pathway VirB4 component